MLLKKSIVNWALLFIGLGIGLGIIMFAAKDLMTTDVPHMNRIAYGEAIYKQHCASCHGENLEGQPNWKTRNDQGRLPAPPHDETGHTSVSYTHLRAHETAYTISFAGLCL